MRNFVVERDNADPWKCSVPFSLGLCANSCHLNLPNIWWPYLPGSRTPPHFSCSGRHRTYRTWQTSASFGLQPGPEAAIGLTPAWCCFCFTGPCTRIHGQKTQMNVELTSFVSLLLGPLSWASRWSMSKSIVLIRFIQIFSCIRQEVTLVSVLPSCPEWKSLYLLKNLNKWLTDLSSDVWKNLWRQNAKEMNKKLTNH